ncbi:UvrD-helicase domain-containing protein [Sinimarinibacterium flocculans]|uniref:DNA 3'-5' helicase n=1 Tax=Sinimarinibacterium flocculans TaxID=985250 RepID=A0A318EGA7_9GAMM|nr:UvrD-helicase domain-containing protein [Sinimarinibacterium flocculans]PXV70980.1 ATP-dependent exoDNAse (exonuclease V) beta subunit [Sinimarinibacterium flocculans]
MTQTPAAPIADAEARAAALDPLRSFIVQAPAGSGKTELLTQRLLLLLAAVDEPEEVVAITFTRKAAAEMRHRVFAAIRAAQSDEAPQDAHRQRTWQLARRVLAQSQTRGWRLHDTPQRLRIRTIDALCAEIVRQSPLGSRLGGGIDIVDNAEPLYREAARAVLGALDSELPQAAPVARVLRHFDNRTARLEQQLVDLLRRRDQWLRLVAGDRKAGRSREVLEAALTGVIVDALQQADRAIPATLRTIWLQSAAHASSQRYAKNPELALHALRDGQWPGCAPAELPRWHALLDLVLTADGSWRATVNAVQGFPAGKTNAEKAELGPARDAHLALLAALSAQPGLRERLAELRELPSPGYTDAQWQVLDALLDTMLLAAAELRLVFAERGATDFAEIAAQAVHALGGPEAPSDLALRLDYRIRHLLVDEFQDTSTTQWQLLERLTAGWTPGDGRTLFAVGDPMQSIYRFREADVGLYLRAREHGIGLLPLTPLTLSCNFRSQRGIVDWVNETFRQVLPPQDDRDRSAVTHSRADAVHPDAEAPAVRLHALIDADDATEAARVVELLREAQSRDADGRIAILVRNRGHLTEIAAALRDAGIGYQAVDIESLAERPVITDLHALTRALLHPHDRIAWLAVLRAPWCGLTLADLHALAADLPAQDSVLTAMDDVQRIAAMSEDGQRRLARLRDVVVAAHARQGRMPLRRWLESTWFALGGAACADGPTALADAASYFDAVQRLAPGAVLEDLTALDLALHDLKASPDPSADERVSVMTIHKSKGLEFDTVIVPGLGRGTRSDDPPPVAWMQISDADGHPRLLMAPVHATGDAREDSYDHLRAREAERQRHEDARLLYVATTRARRCLHLLGNVRRTDDGTPARPPDRSLLARLWPAVSAAFEAAAELPVQRTSAAVPDAALSAPPLRRLRDWPRVTRPAGLPLPAAAAGSSGEPLRFDWAGETARAVGVLYHRWVQVIAGEGIDHWSPARCASLAAVLQSALRGMGVPATRRGTAAERVMQALTNTLADPRGRWLLDNRHAGAASELDLSTLRDGVLQRRVIDRSFVDDGTRWIVDFKTSTHEGADTASFVRNELARYRAQLAGYCALMRDYDAGHPPRAALYLPLIDDPALRWIELDESS